MKLVAEIAEKSHDVEIVGDGELVFAKVDGREYQIAASEPESGVFLLKNNGQIFEASVSEAANGSSSVRIKSGVHEVRIIDPKRLRGASGSDAGTAGKAEIKTAMPGKVVRILVSEGDTVQKGDGVIVVEAMKMQNEMKSPKDGVIAEIRSAEGDTVSAGDVLIVVQ